MSDDPRQSEPPAPLKEVHSLPREIAPPPELEDRVVATLEGRGLLGRDAAPGRPRQPARVQASRWLQVAAAVALLAIGFLAGRNVRPGAQDPAAGSQADSRFALLLYETDGYRPAEGAEEATRYREYSRWVAEARRREQFVTGEDLAVDRGWVLSLTGERASTSSGLAPAEAAPLSGVFLITARDENQALALAQSLPHLHHGGQVVVQKVLPTEQPPSAG